MPAAGSSSLRGVTGRIESILADPARQVAVSEVRLGLGYSAVLLEDGGMGLAYTFRREARGGCCVFDGLRPLVDRPASDLLPLMGSGDRIEAGVGLACACALSNREGKPYLEGDVLSHLELGADDDVGMVGYFGPLVDPVRGRVRRLTVYEWVDEPQGDVRPAREAAEGLKRCQVAMITGTAIINHTIDELLEASRGCRRVAILGASTPLLAEAFQDLNVSLLSGVVARDPASVFQVISEGGGMRQFGPHVDKVNLCVREGATP